MNANVDASTMRRMNRFAVLSLIRDLRTTSRIDVAQLTGLTKATVSHIVDELIREQWVQEIGTGSSSGGRKPVLIRFNANAAHAIGVDVQLSHITTVVCNIRGELTYREVAPIALYKEGPDQRMDLINVISKQIKNAMKSVPKSPYGLVGIGIGVPGTVDFHSGTVYYLPRVYKGEWKLVDELSKEFSLPVICDKDANCGAWHESRSHGAAQQNLVYVCSGIGIGVGIISEGNLYRGRDGMAGEFGHMTINPLGAKCECGNYGCWEPYVSDRGLVRHLREAGEDVNSYDLGRPLVEQALLRAQQDHRSAIRAFHALGQYLGIGVSNILNSLNPQHVVLGGTMALAATFILPEVERVVRHRSVLRNKEISIRVANVNSVAIGASSMAINHVLFSSTVLPNESPSEAR